MAQTAGGEVKSYTNLFERVCALENLYLAARRARKRKTRKRYVEDFELHRERLIHRLQEELTNGTYEPSGYRHFHIHDPKTRLISAAPYRDRVVHHALCNVIGPLLERRFVYDSFSCRKGKGTLAGRERCRRYTNRHLYVLKCDIAKYFQSIDQSILLDKIRRVVRCPRTLRLCEQIIGSARDEELVPAYFPGDELFTPWTRGRGLPIGNLTSQLWANLYLDRMDHFLKEQLRVPGYARYTDDFLLWADDKTSLRECRTALEEFLAAERLRLHPIKTRIIQTKEGVPFLGFRFFPGRAPRLLGPTKRRFEKRTRRQWAALRASAVSKPEVAQSISGWIAFSRYGNTGGLRNVYRTGGFGQTGP